MKLLSYSNKGSRESNQDLLLECKLKNGSYLFLIVDGMGGLEHGEMAARLVCENIETYLSTVDHVSPFQIQMAINKSNLIIRQRSEALRVSMGATLGGVAVQGEEVIYFWVGDVKIIHFRDSRIIFESKSHNLVNELIDSGNIGTVAQLERYRHVVTRSIHGKTKSGLAEIHSNLFNPNRYFVRLFRWFP